MLPVVIPATDGWVIVQRPADGPIQLATTHLDCQGQPIRLTPEAVQILLAALTVAVRDERAVPRGMST